MKISGHWNYRRALVLSSDRMTELNTVLLNFCERIEFAGTTKNNQNIQFETLGEMLNFDNFEKRRLQEIELTGYNNYKRIFKILIKDKKGRVLHYYNTLECFYDFENFDDETLFSSKTKEILRKSTPSYWLVGKFSFFGALCIGSVAYTIVNYMTGNRPKYQLNLKFIILLVIALCVWGIIWLTDNKLYYNIFPAVTFLWKEEVVRYNKWEKFRGNIIWSIFVALIIGLIGTAIAKLIWG